MVVTFEHDSADLSVVDVREEGAEVDLLAVAQNNCGGLQHGWGGCGGVAFEETEGDGGGGQAGSSGPLEGLHVEG